MSVSNSGQLGWIESVRSVNGKEIELADQLDVGSKEGGSDHLAFWLRVALESRLHKFKPRPHHLLAM